MIIFSLIFFSLLISLRFEPKLATYFVILLSGFSIIHLEKIFPFDTSWKPMKRDIRNDLTYMIIIQIALPILLVLWIVEPILINVKPFAFIVNSLWPTQINIFYQALLMLLIADFFRYWLHRLCHEGDIKLLWQLHAIHHSPKRLYCLNVGRFHPLEKMIQYFFDIIPFIFIGVSEEVIGIYFVFYSINGFFQHSNIDIRLGILNSIISGPELHRWHHSRDINESNNNYGNNLIIYDIIFKSYFLPHGKSLDELGLLNRKYPDDFFSQMITPFIKNLDKKQL